MGEVTPDLPVPSETERAAARQQSELSMLRSHTGILAAENSRLKVERDQLSSMLRAMARRAGEQRAEAASETRWATRYFTDWQEARAQVAELRRAAADEPSQGPRRVDDLDVAEAMLTAAWAALRDGGQPPASDLQAAPNPAATAPGPAVSQGAELLCDYRLPDGRWASEAIHESVVGRSPAGGAREAGHIRSPWEGCTCVIFGTAYDVGELDPVCPRHGAGRSPAGGAAPTEHRVDAWRNDDPGVLHRYGWQCYTCGAEDSSARWGLKEAEDGAERHRVAVGSAKALPNLADRTEDDR